MTNHYFPYITADEQPSKGCAIPSRKVRKVVKQVTIATAGTQVTMIDALNSRLQLTIIEMEKVIKLLQTNGYKVSHSFYNGNQLVTVYTSM